MHGVTLQSEDKVLRIGAAETITSAMNGIQTNVQLSPTTFQQALDHWEYVANHVSVFVGSVFHLVVMRAKNTDSYRSRPLQNRTCAA